MKALPGTDARQGAIARGQGGFSLIEIMVSAVVTAVLATSAFYFLSAQNGAGTAGNDVMKSVNLGKQKMDSLKVSAYSSLSSGSSVVANRYTLAWNVSVLTDSAGNPIGRKKIQMNVSWPLTADHTVTLATVKSDDIYREPRP